MSGLRRRDFLRGVVGTSATGALAGCRPTSAGDADHPPETWQPGEPLPWRNWAGNQACTPEARLVPETEAELASALARADGPIRPVGASHSFSGLVPSDGMLVATDMLNGVIAIDTVGGDCEVWSGTRLHQIGPLLEAEGRAMWNMPDIDYQTVAGAISTSTHGTGMTLGSLTSSVRGLTLITPAGDVLECDAERNPEVFEAARCSLGALGVITRVRMATRTSHRLVQRQRIERLDEVLPDVVERAAAHRHFEILALPHSNLVQTMATDYDDGTAVAMGSPDDDGSALRDLYSAVGGIPAIGDALYGGLLSLAIEGNETVSVGPSWQVLSHHRISRFKEMEYTLPADAGPACVAEIMQLIRDRGIPVVYPVELRWVKADDVWLGMFYERDGCTVSIHQPADEDHRPVFDAIEPIFWKYGGRPHWGKLHSLDAERLSELYPRWSDFQAVRRELDPQGQMLNPHLKRVLTESA